MFVFGATAPHWAWATSFTRFLDHTRRRTIVGRTPLNEWSVRCRNLYLHNTQHWQQTNIHVPGGIRTHSLSRRAALDLRLRPRGHWNRRSKHVEVSNKHIIEEIVRQVGHLPELYVDARSKKCKMSVCKYKDYITFFLSVYIEISTNEERQLIVTLYSVAQDLKLDSGFEPQPVLTLTCLV
jgi:hypothetical protein